MDGYETKTRLMIEDILPKAEGKSIISWLITLGTGESDQQETIGVEEKIGGVTHHPAAFTTIHTIFKKELVVMER